jgi:hypothetical protein
VLVERKKYRLDHTELADAQTIADKRKHAAV